MFHEKLTQLSKEIGFWAKGRISTIRRQIQFIRIFLERCDRVMEFRLLTGLEKLLKCMFKKRIIDLAAIEEAFWKQRSSVKWRLEGDRNTHFFHAKATRNKRKNFVQKLEVNGVLYSDQKSKGKAFFDFYCNLMGCSSSPVHDLDWNMLYPAINFQDFSILDSLISVEEVLQVINYWPSNRSPGPDEFTGDFYKHFKHELAPEITSTLNHALQSGSLHPLNSSIIALIPKSDEAISPANFRPISIVHSMQRIFSKIFTNRLTPLLSSLISHNQTEFLRGRSIIDNFAYAKEIISFASKTGTPIKADIHKAFDTLSWRFIATVLQKLGFSSHFSTNVLDCVLNGSSRIVLNGLAGKPIALRRGVRQGDLLSPYIFILAIDFLSRWLSKLNSNGVLPVPIQGMFSGLFYAEDAIIFFKPSQQQAILLKLVFDSFHRVSGLALNSQKSDLVITATDDPTFLSIAAILNCRVSTFPIRYLGLPLSDRKLSNSDYQPLLNRFQTKLNGWSSSLLSKAGRLVLLNSCLSSLPIYFMSIFKLPSWVVKRIDSIRRSFLWHGVRQEKRKLIMSSWQLMTKPKKIRGLGLLDLKAFNTALLTKWLWKWADTSPSLWKPLASSLQNNSISVGPLNSFFSKILNFPQHIMTVGLSHHVSSGDGTLFWLHNWTGHIFKFAYPDLFSFAIDKHITVYTFVAHTSNYLGLFSPLLQASSSALFQLQCLLQEILSPLQHLTTTSIDEVSWKLPGAKGSFSTKSTYYFIKTFPTIYTPLCSIWKLKIPPRFKVFLWLMFQDKIATQDNLQKRGWSMANRCPLCLSNSETVAHLFNHCIYFREFKSIISQMLASHPLTVDSPIPCAHTAIIMSPAINKHVKSFFGIAYFIAWRERCNRIFRGTSKPPDDLLQEAILEWETLL
ncbi:RNA-directed DNA polymerase (reverse transcriptase)-related family protein [Rhynchospora pubera]|uniref:RNA-directed DNA polymerase (Reverse transcriptase)-related family protein n=1 Tax=Rhynchospora pubera TaxID=906938 RepID=A0AAV8H633_9POAL|nr:RNA-directed DNA polymerase (reverse transcriptase)-related family protein [Rhynchospora pubera]